MTDLHHVASGSGWFPLSLTLTIVFAALVYLRGWLRLRSTSSNAISAWRAGSFLAGLFLIWITLASAIAAYDHELLTVHMIQHLLLMTLAPPLIWLGEPVLPFLQGLPRPFVHAVIGLLFRWQPVQELGRILAQPAFCWLAAFAALVVWHTPAAFMLGLQSEGWHILEQASSLRPAFSSGGPSFSPGPASRSQTCRSSCTSFSPRCRATFSLDFLSLATAWSTRFISRHHGRSAFLLLQISSVQAR